MSPEGTDVEVRGRRLRLTNLDKVLYPEAGFTKGQIIDYYARIAPVLVPHLQGRALTRRRWPNGVDGPTFYEKNCPTSRPDWVATATIRTRAKGRSRTESVDYCVVDAAEGQATLVWLANLAAIELHPSLSLASDQPCPTVLAFDLDPGPPAAITECAWLALAIRDLFATWNLEALAKTSGSKGLQVYVPLNAPATYEQTSGFALSVARLLETRHPDRVVSNMTKAKRTGRVLVDWSQNSAAKTTVSVYSLRARPRPTVSTPVRWSEVEAAAAGEALSFEAEQVIERVERHGDLFAPVLNLQQTLPETPEP